MALKLSPKATIVCILLTFFVPLSLAHLMYHYRNKLHLRSKHHGLLLTPTVQLPDPMLSTQSWHWIFIKPEHCDQECKQQQQWLHNIHKTLGKHQTKVAIHASAINDLPRFPAVNVQANSTLLVDARGHAIMYYPPHTNKQALYKDLKRLLQLSKER